MEFFHPKESEAPASSVMAGRRVERGHFDSRGFSYLKNSGSSRSQHKPKYLLIFHYKNLTDVLVFLQQNITVKLLEIVYLKGSENYLP